MGMRDETLTLLDVATMRQNLNQLGFHDESMIDPLLRLARQTFHIFNLMSEVSFFCRDNKLEGTEITRSIARAMASADQHSKLERLADELIASMLAEIDRARRETGA